jgi:hypothetical protein
MSLFLVLSMPLAALVVAAAASSGYVADQGATPGDRVWQFLAGLVSALPSLALLLLVRSALFGSYRPVRLYLSVYFGEELLPVAFAVICYCVVHLAPVFGRDREGLSSVSEIAVFLTGYFSILAIADFVSERPELTGHMLFLVPLLRLSSVAVCAVALPRVVGAAGLGKTVPVATLVALPALASFEGLWIRQGRAGAAVLMTAGISLLVGASLAVRAAAARRGAPVGSRQRR